MDRPNSLPDSPGLDNPAFQHVKEKHSVDDNKPANPKPTPKPKVSVALAGLDLAQDSPSVSGIVDTILAVGRQRRELLAELRAALESGQDKEALTLARRLCGLTL